MKNKAKILHAAKRLFNENGFVNVRLQHISDDTIISVGNIAYHFKNKEAIVKGIYDEWENRLKETLIEFRHTPIFATMDRIFTEGESMQAEYSFFFSDLVEIKRAFPDIFEQIQQFFQWQFLLIKEMLRFNVARGAMKSMADDQMEFLASLLVEQINSWPAKKITWTSPKPKHSKSLSSFCWQLLKPYLSESGQEELLVLLEQRVRLKTDKDHSE
ncbi:MAG: TetR/AcrR family transcriptional regulator [Bacteroidia bacterium]|nr:TetR/AcrR family transcriptional regulator [Bacteroidia bacterium]